MAHFLDRSSSSSETDYSDTESEHSVDNVQRPLDAVEGLNLPPGVYKWLKREKAAADSDTDTDTDSEAGDRVVSKQRKAELQVDALCEPVEMWFEIGRFDKVDALIRDADKIATTYTTKYGALVPGFVERLMWLNDSVREEEKQKEAAAASASDEGEGESDVDEGAVTRHRQHRKMLPKIMRFVSDRVKYWDMVRAAAAGTAGAADEADEAVSAAAHLDTSEAGLLKALDKWHNDPKAPAVQLKRVQIAAQEQGYHYIYAMAAAIRCSMLLAEAARKAIHIDLIHFRTAADLYKVVLEQAIVGRLQITERWAQLWRETSAPETSAKDKTYAFERNRMCIVGGLQALLARLQAALTRWMQWNAATNPKYLVALKEEQRVLELLDATLGFYTDARLGKAAIAALAQSMQAIVAPRTAEVHAMFLKASEGALKLPAGASTSHMLPSPLDMVTKLHQIVVNAAPPAAVVNASIPHLITSLALHERFFEARELFFQAGLHESHAGEGAAVAIATTRCLAHLGLAAFRAGHLGEAAAMLDDLCQKAYRAMKGFEIKELLGQRDSWPRRDDQTADELSAHDLLVPPHHHINVQLIEAAHMTATVLSEALAQARAGQHNTHRLLQDLRRRFEARNLAGAPADDAERLYAAYVAVVEGDATTAVAHVRALNAWNRLAAKEATLEKVCERVKVDALRVFLTAHGGHFKSLTVGHLAQKFGLDADTVRGTVSHMILFQSSSIVASFDRDGDRLDIERGAQPRMHELAREIATGLEQDFREAAKASVMNRRSYGSHGGRGAARGASSAGRGSASAGRGAARGGRGGRGGRGQPRAE